MARQEYHLMSGLKTIYSRDGVPLTDIKASGKRSWLLNDIGQAEFSMATSNVKCNEEYLQFGNYLYIANDKLPPWVGIIDPPRTWHTGFVTITAYEVPHILKYRVAKFGETLTGAAGDIVNQLISAANQQSDTLIRAGYVFNGGISRQETIKDTVFTSIQRLQSRSGNDWSMRPDASSGQLVIYLDWLERAGIVSDVELTQGKNIQYGESPLEESGEIINDLLTTVEDTTTGAIVTIKTTAQDSITSYGLRQYINSFMGEDDSTTVSGSASQFVADNKTPGITTAIVSVDKSSTFQNLRLGNVMNIRYKNVGFSGGGLGMMIPIRIMGMLYDEVMNTVELQLGKA
jgi:hypothetical protein